MLGLLLIFFLGKWLYILAETHGKNKWLFGILAVVIFYATQFTFGIVLGFILGDTLFDMSDLALSLIGIPIGIVGVWIFRSILKSAWEKEALQSSNSELLDDASDF